MEEWICFSWISWAPWGQRPLFLYLWIVVSAYSINSTLNYSASRWESFTGWRKIMLASCVFLDSVCIHWASLMTRSVQRSSQYWAQHTRPVGTNPVPQSPRKSSKLTNPMLFPRAALPCPKRPCFPFQAPSSDNKGYPYVAPRNWEIWPCYAVSQTPL